MKIPSLRFSLAATAALSLAAASPLAAQTAVPPPPGEEETHVLSPFVVEAIEDSGYVARDTLAGTRIRTELKDVGSAVSVVTSQFLQDTGARNNEDLLVYTTNTEVGGLYGNFTGVGNGAVLDTRDARLTPHQNTRVRGLAAADNTRDFFLTDIPWDSYIVGRVDLQRGPNSILFGLGSPAGIINSSINAASFRNSNTVEARFGSFGSYRGSIDLNRALLSDELALRFAALHDKTEYQQDPAFNRDRRLYGALRYDPKFLRGGSARTSIRINYEDGDITANRPRTTPPIDAITPWFTGMNRQTYDPRLVGLTDPAAVAAGGPSAGARQQNLDDGSPSPNRSPWLGNAGRLYDNPAVIFPSETAGTQSGIITGSIRPANAIGPDGAVDGSIGGLPWHTYSGVRTFNDYAAYAELPNQDMGLYKAKSLTDPSIFDFYNKLIDGPNKREWQEFDALNIALSQTFLDNRLGFEAVYDSQSYTEGRVDLLDGFAQALTIDLNSHLVDGTPNPNVGRPMLVSDSQNNFSRSIDRDTFRATAFAELDFKDILDESSWVARFLGRHVFTGLYSDSKNDTRSRTWVRYSTDTAYGNEIRDPSMNSSNRLFATISYLGPSLLNATTAAGANIPSLQAVHSPRTGTARLYNSHWSPPGGVNPGDLWIDPLTGEESTQSENPANYPGWQNQSLTVLNADHGDLDRLTKDAAYFREEVVSKALVWQGYLFSGNLVPTIGWREDTAKNYNAGNPARNSDNSVNLNASTWRLPTTPTNTVKGSTTSWSVVLHTPARLREHLPLGSSLSFFYNESDNFQPAAGRVDVLGNPVDAPLGETQDYGVILTTLNNRLTFKVNWYETSVKNARLDNFGGSYMIWGAEAWGYLYARQAQAGIGGFAGTPYAPGPGQTPEQAAAQQVAAVNAFLANLPPDQFYTAWNINRNNWESWMDGREPTGFTVTGDTLSKGVEYEIVAQPTKNWNLSINAAKTRAQRTNMAPQFAAWVEQRWQVYQGPAGDVRLWGPWYDPNETVRGKFGREFMSGYNLYRLQEGSDVPELRPWRFNIVTNYTFSQGPLRGVNLGGGYRWQDRVVVGYPVTGTGDQRTFDLSRPYKGPTEDAIDLWAGYQRKLANNLLWRIQLNIRNAFDDAHLIPITVQPDGSPGAYRIAEGMTWSISNKFEF